MSKIYILDSRRKWPVGASCRCELFLSYDTLAEVFPKVADDDVLVLHLKDIRLCIASLPEKINSGQCLVVFYSGGTRDDMDGFKAVLDSPLTDGGKLKSHAHKVFYNLEAVSENPSESNLWLHSIQPFVHGINDRFHLWSPKMNVYLLTIKLLLRTCFGHDFRLPNDPPSPGLMEYFRNKSVWKPVFNDDALFREFLEYNHEWSSALQKLKVVYDSDDPPWDELKYNDFKHLIEEENE